MTFGIFVSVLMVKVLLRKMINPMGVIVKGVEGKNRERILTASTVYISDTPIQINIYSYRDWNEIVAKRS